LPARIGLWDYPREFGLFLPLAVAGIGVVLIHLRGRDPEPAWVRPRAPWSPLVLVPWFALPWLLAVLYDPGWPLEDALRPQRLWLLSSQPGAILAAIGLIAVVRQVVVIRWRRPSWTRPAILAVFLLMSVPTVLFTARLLGQTWLQPRYAALRLDLDRVPDMARVLGDGGQRATVLAYEDWSSLVWYETGSWVVAVNPPGYAKLAFDPRVFTGHSQADRRLAVALAFDGDPAHLVGVADAYGADRILVARRDAGWGLVAQAAATAALDPTRVSGPVSLVDGNGWDAEALEPAGRLVMVPPQPGGRIHLEIRVAGEEQGRSALARRFRLVALGTGGSRDLGELVAPATVLDDWQVIATDVVLEPGERVAIDATDRVIVQSVLGFAPADPPPGWQVSGRTNDAVVLARLP
ncbi:MAG: hypothetical protein ABIQ76_03340, partial [Candidatus Limnocylindrales bacterium]